MELYEKLIHLRKQKGLSQLKLAEELGVSRQAISKWEVGTAVPSTENLRSLSKLYMTVSNNTVTSVFDDTISVIGGTYEDDELTMTSTYGKLSFKVTSLGSIMSGKCWLKGTVTGSEDKIDVSWRM